jgi:hypothetical protein
MALAASWRFHSCEQRKGNACCNVCTNFVCLSKSRYSIPQSPIRTVEAREAIKSCGPALQDILEKGSRELGEPLGGYSSPVINSRMVETSFEVN